MKERFIFDLDGTILNGNFSKEIEYFKSVLPFDEAYRFEQKRYQLLQEYEKKFLNYDVNYLSDFLSKELDATITPQIIQGWIDINCDIEDEIEEDVIELLEYLKGKDKSIVVLSNWFRKTQDSRLRKMLLSPYFDQVYGGDTYLKPSRKAYLQAAGSYPIQQCVMIGDNYEKDYLGAKNIGMDAIYYDKMNTGKKADCKVKTLKRIKEMY